MDDLLMQLIEIANKRFDGHLTIMKFTRNWRVSCGTPYDRFDVMDMPVGAAFKEAAQKALADPRSPDGSKYREAFYEGK